jgi:predicted RNA binding protein YcfA (HicA-like mRNA interferase family)
VAQRLPALKPDRIVRALEACGLEVVRQRGSHASLWKAGLRRPVVIARHNRELSPSTVSKIIEQAEVNVDDFLKHV